MIAPPAGVEQLTERERRALELLAYGHTIKTVAAECGATEAAMQEVLRSARRKLNVGSSREAARMAAAAGLLGTPAQKNRDRISGLPGDHGDEAGPAGPVTWRPVMLVALSLALGAAVTAAVVPVLSSSPPVTQPVKAAAPRVVASDPANGATVPAGPFVLRVTFDQPMQRDSYSFATGPENRVPRCDPRAEVSPDGRTFSLRCRAIAGRSYVIWANHGRFANFRSVTGVPAAPTRIAFRVAPG